MHSKALGWLRGQLAGVIALVVLVSMYQLAKLPSASAEDVDQLAEAFAFTPFAVPMPQGYPTQDIRAVNRDFANLQAWVSSVGAGIAMNDLDGDGLANDLCVSEPRIDQVVIAPAPVAGGDRYLPFGLDPGRLPVDRTMAPMGCAPGDFNRDGRMDLLVYYWGRTPIIFLARAGATELGPAAYHPVEMVSGVSADGRYTGPLWNSNSVAVADFDGDGHEDIFVGNYWPHGPVLDPAASGDVAMPYSLSNALNGGESYIFRWTGAAAGPEPDVTYQEATGALADDWASGWALASAAADLDGDLLPELYIAHDFGKDRLLYNTSTPGDIQFTLVQGAREPLVPKSKVLGQSSFKGMGVDFGDLSGDGLYDIFVSNITTSFGIQESNFAFVGTAESEEDLGAHLADGRAPFEDRSAPLGLAWVGWGWDAKLADLDRNGELEVVQTNGFVQGKTDRWPQLQEMATANDSVIADPYWWPDVLPGDDIAGNQTMALFVKGDGGRYVDLSGALGMAIPVPTRGVALGDATGDGRLDLAVARQWDEPVFYRNDSEPAGEFLGLRLIHDSLSDPDPDVGLPAAGSPVVGARVRVTTPDGRTLVGHVDGGGGHSGKRSHEVFIGLGEVGAGPLQVRLEWRDRDGTVRKQELRLTPGWHTLRLGAQAREETP